MRKLSSSWTWLYKIAFPTVWIGGFGFGTLLLFIPGVFQGDGKTDVNEMRQAFLVGLMLGSAFLYWGCMRLKSVALDGTDLVISNFRETIHVPLRDVDRVSGSLLLHPELMWIVFRTPNRFGTKIVFMPKWRLLAGYTWNPLVKELKGMVLQVRGTGA